MFRVTTLTERSERFAPSCSAAGKQSHSSDSAASGGLTAENANEPEPEAKEDARRYMPGLDGLRALAVLAVLVYHLYPSWAPGGLLGVGLFFALSGYLITDILIAEWKRNGRIDLKDFWIRRMRRLLPALLVLVGSWLLLTDRSRLPQLQGDIITSLLYVNNWWLIYHDVSYFEKFGPLSPLGHLWSLAVEEQFYAIWPIALLLGLRFAPRRGRLAAWIAAGAAVSAIAMALLYRQGTAPSRVYYGMDTRAFALLLGAALAVLWPSGKLPALTSRAMRLAVDLAGGAGLIVMLLMIRLTDEYDAFLIQPVLRTTRYGYSTIQPAS